MNNTIIDIKNILGIINSRLGDTEECISDVKQQKPHNHKGKKKTNFKNWERFKDLWISNCTNIHIIGVLEGEESERKRTSGNIWSNNSWKLPCHGKGNSYSCLGSTESQVGKPKE